ncbi:MAG: 3-deoxy-7-phosphoheptulonate synthase [Acidimicrobiales bacterium]
MVPSDRLNDRHIVEVRHLVAPATLRNELPLTAGQQEVVLAGRIAAASILRGADDRLIVVVGPCSVHDPASALEYARRLRALRSQVGEELVLIMRVYFEKPRSALGWKGLINDPGLDGSNRVNDGLYTARSLLLEILSLGVPVACEFLEPITPQYIADAVSWGAIGARTTHSQVHRQLASGLSMPVGFKNSIEGDVQGAVDAVLVASRSQVFPGITYDGIGAIFTTAGNPDCHVVLRGSTSGPNYGETHVFDAVERLERAGLTPRLIIDASHGNSGKDHRRQQIVAAEIATRLGEGERGIAGVMIESYLIGGRQELEVGRAAQLRYGQSITDSCMGWQTTVDVVRDLARASLARRSLVETPS